MIAGLEPPGGMGFQSRENPVVETHMVDVVWPDRSQFIAFHPGRCGDDVDRFIRMRLEPALGFDEGRQELADGRRVGREVRLRNDNVEGLE